MGILTTLLQGLSGIIGGLNGNVGLQILGSGAIDMGSMSPVTALFTPPVGNNAQLVAIGGVLRLPSGIPAPTAAGYPLQVAVRFNGIQGFVLQADVGSFGLASTASQYVFTGPTAAIPLGTNTVITAQMVVPSASSTSGIFDVIGYAVSAT